MSIKRMSAIWDDSPQRGTRLLILLAIADHANDDGLAWPGLKSLAKKARISRRVLISHNKKMEATRDLIVFRRAGRHNLYIIPTGITQTQFCACIERISARWKMSVEEVVISASPVLPASPVIPVAPGGDTSSTGTRDPHSTGGVIPVAPESLLNPHVEPTKETPVSCTPAELADAKPPHVAVIEDGYLATMRELGRTVIDGKRDPIKSRVGIAAALVAAGHDWRDVRGFLRWYYSDKNTDDPFWKKKAKPMPLENAAEMIPTWARKHKQRPPYRAKVAVPAPAWVKAIDEADPDVFAHEDDLAAADAREQPA